MNLRAYYQKIRDIEQSLLEPFVILISCETPDGGKEGVLTEVPRLLAARMIVDGRAALAGEALAHAFHEHKNEAKRLTDQAALGTRMHVTVTPASEPRKVNRLVKD
jgi:hypothetical protein